MFSMILNQIDYQRYLSTNTSVVICHLMTYNGIYDVFLLIFDILASHKQFGSIENRVLHILALQFNRTKMPDLSELKRQLHILKLATGSELKMVDDEPVKTFLSKNGIDKKGTKYQVRRESLERFKIRASRTHVGSNMKHFRSG